MSSKIVKQFITDHRDGEITKQEGNFSLLVWGIAPLFLYSPLFTKYYQLGDFGSMVFLVTEKKGIGFFSLDDYRQSTEITFKKYLKNTSHFTEPEDHKKIQRESNSFYIDSHPSLLLKISNQELYGVIIKSSELIREWQTATLFCEMLDEKMVKESFNRLNDSDLAFEEFYHFASISDFESLVYRQNECFKKYDKRDDLYSIQWALASYLMAPSLDCTDEVFREVISDSGGIEKIRKEQIKNKEEISKNKIGSDKFYQKLSNEAKKLFDFIKLSIVLRDSRKETTYKLITILCNSAREIFSRLELPLDLVIYSMFSDFVEKKYEDNNYVDILKARKNGFLVYYGEEGIKTDFIKYDETKEELSKLIANMNFGNTITGVIANKGVVRARVKIILDQGDFHKMKNGDILVTSMTRPEFIPLMKRSSAIITDEGGITCHAAIISRELGKPCIIGTKIATQVLRDGDEVEVDANEGVIKILKK